jgi:AP-3 complex subunit mu
VLIEFSNCILEHVYQSRPPSPKSLLSQFKACPAPRPALLYLSESSPPTAVASVYHSNTLFLCPSSTDRSALALLEFVHRVIDVFEDFLGAPLLADKIESNYDIVAQLLNEICDGGAVSNTEPNALRENVEVAGLIGKLFTQVGLPGYVIGRIFSNVIPALTTSCHSSSPALGSSNNLASSLKAGPNLTSGPALPWRRSNVRHTSNELYVDVLEKVSVILAPSGRPISAISSGYIAFTAKISGVPDLLLTLSAPGGSSSGKGASISRIVQSPVFHPCVRLARWKEQPGEISFVPPDGRFVLAGYEVNLLPSYADADRPPEKAEKLFMPATVDLRTGLGEKASDLEVRLTLNTNFPGSQTVKSGTSSSRPGTSTPSFSFAGSNAGSSNAPILEAVVVSVPLPDCVRSVTDLRPSRGEAHFQQYERSIIWKVSTKDSASVNGTAVLLGTLIGPIDAEGGTEDVEDIETSNGTNNNPLLGYYDETSANITDAPQTPASLKGKGVVAAKNESTPVVQQRRSQANRALMPRSVNVSFNVRGWLPSGIKVDGLVIDQKRSKGLGEGVKPYRGVKYLTVSRKGVERRA